MTSARAGLDRAYRAAQYWVLAEEPFFLRVDAVSPPLDRLLANHAAVRAALLTAANPASRQVSALQNAHGHEVLAAAVGALGLIALPASNRDPDGKWPDEPGLLVLQITLTAARQLASQFGQNAWLWCELAAPVRLVWTEDP